MMRVVCSRGIRTTFIAAAVLVCVGCGTETALPIPTVLNAADVVPVRAEYSPDGTRIAYLDAGLPGRLDVFVADADMSNALLLSSNVLGSRNFILAWSPDGGEIALTRSEDSDIWAVPTGEGTPRRLTQTPGREHAFRYHPDGQRFLAFVLPAIHLVELDLTTLASRDVTLNGESAFAIPSPDGTQTLYGLGFAGPERTLWVVDGDGGAARQLTRPEDRIDFFGAGDAFPAWSPDGRHVAYVSDRTGWGDLWVVSVGDGVARQLTHDIREDYQPQWSPDGRWIAFLSDRGRQTDVWLVSIESGEEIRVTDDADVEMWLRWRPGSTELKYEVETERNAIWALSLADGSERRLTPDMPLGFFELSPTGGEVVYEVDRGGGAMDLMIVSTAGGEPRPLVANGNRNVAPAWSPDGSQVVFVSNRAGSADIWVVNGAGGEPRRLTDDPGVETAPRWSYDGSLVHYMSNRDAQLRNVWSVRPDGGDAKPVTTDGNIGDFFTLPDRADLLLNLTDNRVNLLAPDGGVRFLWTGNRAVADDDQPGGDWVLINRDPGNGVLSPVLVSPTSGAVRQLPPGVNGPSDWSPDGRRFLYSMPGTSDIAIFTVADSTVQRLTDTPEVNEGGALWSSDGQTIVFQRGRIARSLITVDVGRQIGR